MNSEENKAISTEETENVEAVAEPLSTQKEEKKDAEKLYPVRLSKFKSFYLLLVIICAIGLGAAVYIAVAIDLLKGALIAAASIFIYLRFGRSMLDDSLGMYYKTNCGVLSVTRCRARYGDIFYIPARLMWYDVTELCDRAFFSALGKNREMHTVYIPKSITHIGKDVFASCDSLVRICYEGSREDFEKIEIETDLFVYELNFDVSYTTK